MSGSWFRVVVTRLRGRGAALAVLVISWMPPAGDARASPPAAEPAGVWLAQVAEDRVLLAFFGDGRYEVVREQPRAGSRVVAAQWDRGRFSVAAAQVVFTREPTGCHSRLEGAFRVRFVGGYLLLEGRELTLTLVRLPRRGDQGFPAPPEQPVYGCFVGDAFVARATPRRVLD
jgi:hypothetical protein